MPYPISNARVKYRRPMRYQEFAPYYTPRTQISTLVYRETVVNKGPTVTVNYTKAKKSGNRLKPLPYFHTETSTSINYGSSVVRTKGGILLYLLTGSITQPAVVLDRELSTAAACRATVTKLATNAFLNGIKDSKFNGAQAYAESKQLHMMIGDTTRKLAGVFQHLRKGQLSAAALRLGVVVSRREATRYTRVHDKIKSNADIDKMLAKGVLAVQYGIRPLIGDVIGAAELYAQKRCEEVVNTFTKVVKMKFDETNSGKGRWSQGSVQTTGYLTGQVDVKLSATFAKGDEVIHSMKQLGLTNPLLLAWELLPWSFVIDWFIPIGNYISSIDATLGLDFKTGYTSTKTVLNWQVDQVLTGKGATGTNPTEDGLSSQVSYEKSFTRSIMTAFPSSRLPEFKNPLSLEHAVNGIALLMNFKKSAYAR